MGKSKIIEKLFFDIVTYSYLLLPVAFFVSKSNKKAAVPLSIATYGLVFLVLLFFYDDIPKDIKKYYQSFYTFLEYAFFAFFFWYNVKNKKIRRIIVYLSIGFFIFQIIYVFGSQLSRLDSVPIGIETIVILAYIFYFFYEFSQNLSANYVYNHYCFWISVGVLIYLGGSFFFYILINHLTDDQVTAFGNLTFLAEIIKNVLFATAIFIYSRYPFEKTKNKSESIPFLDMI